MDKNFSVFGGELTTYPPEDHYYDFHGAHRLEAVRLDPAARSLRLEFAPIVEYGGIADARAVLLFETLDYLVIDRRFLEILTHDFDNMGFKEPDDFDHDWTIDDGDKYVKPEHHLFLRFLDDAYIRVHAGKATASAVSDAEGEARGWWRGPTAVKTERWAWKKPYDGPNEERDFALADGVLTPAQGDPLAVAGLALAAFHLDIAEQELRLEFTTPERAGGRLVMRFIGAGEIEADDGFFQDLPRRLVGLYDAPVVDDGRPRLNYDDTPRSRPARHLTFDFDTGQALRVHAWIMRAERVADAAGRARGWW